MLQAARETGALQEAKSKLEKEVEELTWHLQLEKRMRVKSYATTLGLDSIYFHIFSSIEFSLFTYCKYSDVSHWTMNIISFLCW